MLFVPPAPRGDSGARGNPDRESLHVFIRENVAGDTEVIYTDEWEAYKGIVDGDTRHEAVKHPDRE